MPYVDVHGRCPACGTENLHLSAASRMVVCLAPRCPDKGAAQSLLLGESALRRDDGEPALRRVAYDMEDGEATLEADDSHWPLSRLIRLESAELADYEAARERWLLWQGRLWGHKGEHREWLESRTFDEERPGG